MLGDEDLRKKYDEFGKAASQPEAGFRMYPDEKELMGTS